MASGIYLIGRDLLVEPYIAAEGLKVCSTISVKEPIRYSGIDEVVGDVILAAIKNQFWTLATRTN